MTSSVEESCSPEQESKAPSLPQQECSKDPHKIDEKSDARIPTQEEEPNANKGQCMGRQMDDLDKPDYRMPSQEEGNDSITCNDDDDVFDSTGINKYY